jgi:hypothetical protein
VHRIQILSVGNEYVFLLQGCPGFSPPLFFTSEIVLSVLLAKFKFAPSGKNIVWLSNGIVQPAVEDPKRPGFGETELQLPLKVSLVAE